MADQRVEVVSRRALVTVSGAALISPLVHNQVRAQTAQDATTLLADRAGLEAALRQMQELASSAPDAPSILGKLDKADYLTTSHIAGDGRADDTAALQAAIDDAAARGRPLHILPPAEEYRITSTLNVPAGSTILGNGRACRIRLTSRDAISAVAVTGADNVRLEGLTVVGANVDGQRGIYAESSDNLTVRECNLQSFLHGLWITGAYRNVTVTDNRLWGGRGNGLNAVDISIYGSDGQRVIVAHNFCLSNNDTGISVDANNNSHDVIIASNVIVPLGLDGASERSLETRAATDPNTDIMLRFGIMVGYAGGGQSRTTITGNIVRRAAYCGIYLQGAETPSGTAAVVGNMVSECGFGRQDLWPDNAGLRGAIHLASGGADTVLGNVVTDCWACGVKISPSVGRDADAPRASVSGNTIANTRGSGIQLTNKCWGYNVTGNTIYGCVAAPALTFDYNGTTEGHCRISENLIEVAGIHGGMLIDAGATAYSLLVSNNKIIGSDSTTSNDNLNVGISARGPVLVVNNVVERFSVAISVAGGSTRSSYGAPCGNIIADAGRGILASGSGMLLASGNQFRNVREPLFGAIAQGTTLLGAFGSGEPQFITNTFDGKAPSLGAYAIGDICLDKSPTAGGTLGWVCTAGGSPGVWAPFGVVGGALGAAVPDAPSAPTQAEFNALLASLRGAKLIAT